MIPTKGQYVKVIFYNDVVMEGIVEIWSDAKSVLISLDGESSCLIMNTAQDVFLVKTIKQPQTQKQLQQQTTQLEKQFEEIKAEPSGDELRLKKLADLKQMMVDQEKKIISAKIKNTNIQPPQVSYKYPGFFLKDLK